MTPCIHIWVIGLRNSPKLKLGPTYLLSGALKTTLKNIEYIYIITNYSPLLIKIRSCLILTYRA